MSGRKCFAPNCRTGYRGTNEKRFTFTCKGDEETFKCWQKKIPRSDKIFTRSDRLCELHFQRDDIIRAPHIIQGGEVVELTPYERPKLKESAVPSIWPNCPSYLTKVVKNRKPPKARTCQPIKRKRASCHTAEQKATPEGSSSDNMNPPISQTETDITKKSQERGLPVIDDLLENQVMSTQEGHLLSETTDGFNGLFSVSSPITCFGSLECKEERIVLPQGWIEIVAPFASFKSGNKHCFGQVQSEILQRGDVEIPTFQMSRGVTVDFERKKINYFMNSKLCDEQLGKLDWKCFHELSGLIEAFSMMHCCSGIPDQPEFSPVSKGVTTGELQDGIWRSKRCEMLCSTQGKLCPECNRLGDALRKRAERHINSKKLRPSVVPKLQMMTVNQLLARLKIVQKENRNLTRQVIRLTKRLKRYQEETKILRKDLNKAMEKTIDESLIPKEARVTYRTFVRHIKCTNKKGMRYEAEWLLQCLLLRTKSSSAYDHLRNSGLLPLPSKDTLRRLISSVKCHFGYNKMALEAIRQAFMGKSLVDRMGTQSHDEMSVLQGLTYNKQDFCFDGLVCLENEEPDEPEENEEDFFEEENVNLDITEDQLANHAFVLMFRPLNDRWVQPFASFASHGAAPSNAITRLCMKSFIILHHYGAVVSAVVCDGAQPNKGFWKNVGVGCFEGNKVVNSMQHPMDNDHTIRFLLDPPHAFKTIRNMMLKYNVVQFAGKKVTWETIKDLYTEDEKLDVGGFLRMCPKLRSGHVNPSNFEKMNVKKMAQVFSKSVASALKLLEKHPSKSVSETFKSERSVNMAELLELLNDVFDILNGRCSKNAIRIAAKDPRYKWENCKNKLDEFDRVIVQTLEDKSGVKTFASLTTLHALRVTIKSVAEIVEHLFSLGVETVLTGKANQDCLERFFGIIRSAGGGQDKPTVSSFKQLFRLLILYYPTKEVLRGANVDNEDRPHLLTSYEKWLRKGFKEGQKRRKILMDYIKDTLLDGICVEMESSCGNELLDEKDEEKFAATVKDNVIFYISGYMARKQSRKRSKCPQCIQTMTSNGEESIFNSASELTRIKSHGMLKIASDNLFNLFARVENVVHEFVNKSGIFKRNAFYDVAAAVVVDTKDESLPQVGCEHHYRTFMTDLIYDYLLLRFNCIGKGKCLQLCEKRRSEIHKKTKLAKLGAGDAARKRKPQWMEPASTGDSTLCSQTTAITERQMILPTEGNEMRLPKKTNRKREIPSNPAPTLRKRGRPPKKNSNHENPFESAEISPPKRTIRITSSTRKRVIPSNTTPTLRKRGRPPQNNPNNENPIETTELGPPKRTRMNSSTINTPNSKRTRSSPSKPSSKRSVPTVVKRNKNP